MFISILVPIYNVEKYIGRCARSLFEQTYPDIEYIFVDDCSPDHSIDVLKRIINEYPKRKENIRIIRHKVNRGLAAARNTGVDAAIGDFIMHVDSDDWLETNAVQWLVEKQMETNADIVSGNAISHTKNGEKLLTEPDYANKTEMINRLIDSSLDHVIWRRLIRRSLYVDNNIHAKEGINIGEDWQVMPILTYYATKFAKIDKCIYHYNRMNENSYTTAIIEFNYKHYMQDIQSLEVLKEFFMDKSAVFNATISKNIVVICYSYLLISAAKKNKTYYKEILVQLKNYAQKDTLADIGWNNRMKRIFDSHYQLCRIHIIFANLKTYIYNFIIKGNKRLEK